MLAGFSQGGVIALRTGLLYPAQLAGIMALSTYLPMADQTHAERSPTNATTSVFFAHGALDPLIPIEVAEDGCDFLRELGYPVEWHRYQMDHSVCAEELADISEWLSGVLA